MNPCFSYPGSLHRTLSSAMAHEHSVVQARYNIAKAFVQWQAAYDFGTMLRPMKKLMDPEVTYNESCSRLAHCCNGNLTHVIPHCIQSPLRRCSAE